MIFYYLKLFKFCSNFVTEFKYNLGQFHSYCQVCISLFWYILHQLFKQKSMSCKRIHTVFSYLSIEWCYWVKVGQEWWNLSFRTDCWFWQLWLITRNMMIHPRPRQNEPKWIGHANSAWQRIKQLFTSRLEFLLFFRLFHQLFFYLFFVSFFI